MDAFAKNQSLTVDVENGEGEKWTWTSYPIEKLIGDHAHAIAGSAANTAVWRVAKSAKEISNRVNDHLNDIEPQMNQQNKDQEGARSKRIEFLTSMLNDGFFHELKDRFQEFAQYLEVEIPLKVRPIVERDTNCVATITPRRLAIMQLKSSSSEEEVEEVLKQSDEVNGAPLAQWKQHAGVYHFKQYLSGLHDIPTKVEQPMQQTVLPGTGIDGDFIVASIPDDAVANDGEDNTYGIRGWSWPPDRPEEQILRQVTVDKFADSDIAGRLKNLEFDIDEYVDMIVSFYYDTIPRIKDVMKAASAFREDGKLHTTNQYGENKPVETIIKESAHAIKGGSSNLGLYKLWKIAKLVELPNKAFWEQFTDENNSPSTDERRKFLNKFTRCPNLLFLWVQYRNLVILLKDILPQHVDKPLIEILESAGENCDGKDENGESYVDLYERILTSQFDSHFHDVVVYNPFGNSYYPPSSLSAHSGSGREVIADESAASLDNLQEASSSENENYSSSQAHVGVDHTQKSNQGGTRESGWDSHCLEPAAVGFDDGTKQSNARPKERADPSSEDEPNPDTSHPGKTEVHCTCRIL